MRRVLPFAVLGAAALVALVLLRPWGDDAPRRSDARSGSSLYDASGAAIGKLPEARRRPNVVLIVIDTLRADAAEATDVGPGMPYLRSLAKEGISFTQASANAPWTKPSISSLLTGLLPSQHGNADSRRAPYLAAGVTTFAEVLSRSYGYETVAFVDTPLLGGPEAVLQGFTRTENGFYLQATHSFVAKWATARDPKRPFLLVLHTYEAHEPYGARNHAWPLLEPEVAPPPAAVPTEADRWEILRAFFLDRPRRLSLQAAMGRSATRIIVNAMGAGYAADPQPDLAADLRRAYLEGASWVDGLLRTAVTQLQGLGLLEGALLVVASDHGESFGEHGQLGHGRQMYDELLRVPLVMRGPAPFAGGRLVETSVGMTDVLPTLLDWAGIPPPGDLDGRSFLPAIEGADRRDHAVIAEEVLSEDNTGRSIEATVTSVRTSKWKWILTYERMGGTIVEELYDLEADPLERENRIPPASQPLEVGPEACSAIRRVRERVWQAARGDQERVGTPYGASVGRLRSEEPAGCR